MDLKESRMIWLKGFSNISRLDRSLELEFITEANPRTTEKTTIMAANTARDLNRATTQWPSLTDQGLQLLRMLEVR